jgi:hypothetical protein
MPTLADKVEAKVKLYQLKLALTSLWCESASELYRPIDRRLSAKLMPTLSAEISF